MKPWLLRLHRWSGLLIAAVVLVVGSTGAVTAYQAEFDRWLNPDLLHVEPQRNPGGGMALPMHGFALDALVRAAEVTGVMSSAAVRSLLMRCLAAASWPRCTRCTIRSRPPAPVCGS